MRDRAFFGAAMLGFALAACGGSEESAEPVEQILVAEPGSAAPITAAVDAVSDLIAAGESAFAVCAACHVVDAGAPSAAGPNLNGVIGRQAGMLDDFAYSDALSSSGITWDEAAMDQFLANPTSTVPGTSMVAGAVSDDERRAAIIAYLAALNE